MTKMKFRVFIEPGELLELEATLIEAEGDNLTIVVEARRGQKLAGAARAQLRSASRQPQQSAPR
jgi:3-hydroxymyristoyl/3-hydroxydecanoyl-(acyl carrier protein) dehydratase